MSTTLTGMFSPWEAKTLLLFGVFHLLFTVALFLCDKAPNYALKSTKDIYPTLYADPQILIARVSFSSHYISFEYFVEYLNFLACVYKIADYKADSQRL